MKLRDLQQNLEELIFVGQAHKIGIFEELYKRLDTSVGLALRMNFDKKKTWVLLESLVEMGYLECNNAIYSVSDDIFERLVNKGGEEYEGDFWQFLLYLIDPWRTLPYVLKHGKPDQLSYKNFSMNDFIKGMDSPWKKKIAPEVVDVCLKHCMGANLVVDIGGSPGTIARAFLDRGIQTIIYDLPESLDVTRKELETLQNLKIQSGDATMELPPGVYDIAFLGNLCHGQSPDDNQKIIEMCYSHIRDEGIIVIFDNIRGESYLGATLALHMMTQSPFGNIYSREEYLRWLEKAGFRNTSVEILSDKAWQLIVAYK